MNIRRLILTVAGLTFFICSAHAYTNGTAATTKDGKTLTDNIFGVYKLYPSKVSPAPSAPRGYRLCHLSHYGRHGSRFTQYDTVYTLVRNVLERAYADGRLTQEGLSIRERYKRLYPVIENRAGELSRLGQRQHREIARRMIKNYPSLFRKGSKVTAFSTNLERTMLSMMSFCDEMHAVNPGIRIEYDASKQQMGYLNPHWSFNPYSNGFDEIWKGTRAPWRVKYKRFCHEYLPWREIAQRIFTDVDYACGICDVANFEQGLYFIAIGMPNITESDENFFDVFTLEEFEKMAVCGDCYTSYLEKGLYPKSTGRASALCLTLLQDFIDMADKDMAEGNQVRLRFGHDGCMMGMFVLMGLEGWTVSESDPVKWSKIWDISRIPMAANIQIAFYRDSRRKGPVLINFRLNEENLDLPLEEFCPGFYRWDDFKAYYVPLIRKAAELLHLTADEKPENYIEYE